MRKSVVIGLCIVGAAIVVAKSRKRTPVSTTVSPIVPTVDSEIIFEIIPSPGSDDNTELVGAVDMHIAGDTGKEYIMENCVEAWCDAFECMQDVGGDESQCADLIAIERACRDNEMGRVMQIGYHRSEPIDPIVGRCIGYMADLVNGDAYYSIVPEHLPYGISRFDGGIEMTWAWKLYAGDHEDILHRDWLYDFQAALQNEGHTAVVHGDTLHINCAEDGNGTLGFALKRCQDGYMPMNGYCMQQWFQEVIN